MKIQSGTTNCEKYGENKTSQWIETYKSGKKLKLRD